MPLDRLMIQIGVISEEKKEIAENLFRSGISEEFIALQLDLDTADVKHILQKVGAYRPTL